MREIARAAELLGRLASDRTSKDFAVPGQSQHERSNKQLVGDES
jgi:hypothetical protein